ncbi:MAG: hypothetical protein ABI867_28620, partial [Kofleriaceae bacterium]
VTRCLECKKTLEDLYAGDPAISFGLCEQHGVWLDRASREIFEAVFAKAIGANAGRRNTVDARVRELTQEVEALATKLAGDETVSRHELARRVVVLERALVEIAQRVERLERTNRGPG